MPIEIGFWRLKDGVTPIEYSPMETEKRLEEVLTQDITIVDPGFMLVGRQVPTATGKFIDLLALDSDGNLVVIELKRNRTPREVIAQLLDYGAWIRALEEDDVSQVFENFLNKYDPDRSGTSLDDAFCEHFEVEEMPEQLNDSHKLVVVAAQLDDSTERIINYLSEEYGVDINAVFFRFFRDDDREYLSRAWLIAPEAVEATVEKRRTKLPWNGEFYVSFGANPNRDWEEARKYGFVSAGGGTWYTKTLSQLEPGARIWVNIPKVGYVGVGRVTEPVVAIDDFKVEENGESVPITSLPLKAAKLRSRATDPEKAEHVVRVEWIKTVPASKAIKEKGFFGNQNTVAKPGAKKWEFTIRRLKEHFGITE